jgi:ring-1,2-phenylacetyl-CoA epoxidase subunit PaaB
LTTAFEINFILVKSLDPRVNRLPELSGTILPKAPLDQLGTYEVFVQPKEGKAFQHEGIVHAPDLEMSYVLAKETFTRRFTCTSLYVTDTRCVFVSPMSEGNIDAYDLLGPSSPAHHTQKVSYEIFHLAKRGKQHVHAGTVEATSPQEAMIEARNKFKTATPVINVWAIRSADIRFTSPEEKDLWNTLPDKKFRDASSYKGGDKLKEFLERNNVS